MFEIIKEGALTSVLFMILVNLNDEGAFTVCVFISALLFAYSTLSKLEKWLIERKGYANYKR